MAKDRGASYLQAHISLLSCLESALSFSDGQTCNVDAKLNIVLCLLNHLFFAIFSVCAYFMSSDESWGISIYLAGWRFHPDVKIPYLLSICLISSDRRRNLGLVFCATNSRGRVLIGADLVMQSMRACDAIQYAKQNDCIWWTIKSLEDPAESSTSGCPATVPQYCISTIRELHGNRDSASAYARGTWQTHIHFPAQSACPTGATLMLLLYCRMHHRTSRWALQNGSEVS